jgi:glycosyltransferase involved in cell wall biosynthesis
MKPLLFSILPRPPHPTRDGLAIRNYYLLRSLAAEFRVKAFVLRASGLERGHYPDGVEGLEIPLVRRSIRKLAAVAESVLGGRAYPLSMYRSWRLARALRDAASKHRPAWVVAHSYHVGPFALECDSRAWIDFHNVDSEIWQRVGESPTSERLAAWFARLQSARVRRWERRLAAAAAGISCVSERDAQVLSGMGPPVPPLVVPNGVDLERYAFRARPASSKRIFFVGDLSWPPNAQAVRWLQREIWPRVLRNCPGAAVEILGRGVPADLRRAADAGFRFLGEGGDTRPHWQEVAVAVVPLLAAGGTRLKILEAAACGVPVVSTRIGAEGLELDPEREILLRDTPESFAAAVSELLGDPGRGARLARAARARVEANYDWRAIGSRFARELVSRSLS